MKDNLTEAEILSIIFKIKNSGYSESETLNKILDSSELTETIIEKMIWVINLNENGGLLLKLIDNPKITECLLDKIVDKVTPPFNEGVYLRSKVYYAVAKSPKITSKLSDKIFKNIKAKGNGEYGFSYYIDILIEIAASSETSSETLDKILELSDPIDSRLLQGIAFNPNISLETFIKILDFIKDKSFIISIISNPEIKEELLNESIKRYFSKTDILIKIIESPKLTSQLLVNIIKLTTILICPGEERSLILTYIIKSPKITEKLLKELIESCDLNEVKDILSKCEFLNQGIIDDLYEKANKNMDIILFEKILYLEKPIVKEICKDANCDNKMDYRQEYFKLLNRYLSSSFCGVKLMALKFMLMEGFLTEKELLDSEYINVCPRSLKLCPEMKAIILEKKNNGRI